MNAIYQLVVLLCFFTTTTAQINFPNTKIKYVVSGDTLTQPYYRNISLDSTSEHIKYAIVSLHGDGRNSYEHFSVITELTTSVGLQDSTILLAPTYPIQDDINQYNLDDNVLYWPDGDWNAGDLSRNTQSNPRPFRISSFSTVDTIYHRLAENNPNLKKIVLTGHSAGSQMVVRYAAGGRAQGALGGNNIEFVYVPVNTPSFLYYDGNRVLDEATEVFDFGPTGCTSANQYKYGLDNLNQYMETTGETTIIDRFKLANTTYLIGQYDFGGQTNTCARMVQGYSRLIRTHIYFSYVGYFYGDTIYNNHRMAEIPGASHDFGETVLTDCGKKSIFDVGECGIYVDGTQLFNHRPIAIAGADQLMNPGNLANLNASESYDQDGEIETYSWTQLLGSPIDIEFSDSVFAQFIVPEEGFVDVQLLVVDNEGKSGKDTVRFVINQPPTSNAGGDQGVGYSEVVLLDGSESTDENGEISSFLWEQLGGEAVSIFSADQEVATFYSPATEGSLSFVLSVFDEQGLGDKDTTNIFVSSLSVSTKEAEKGKNKVSLSPNPFNSSLSINFVNQGDLQINSVTVYDVVGKKIQQWFVSNKTEKNTNIYWGGKDERGFEIRSGLYFVRIESNNGSIIKKVTYLK